MSWRRCVLLTGVLLGISACGHYEEIARLPSPDGRVDAVVVEVEAGSGNPFVYQLHLVGRGEGWRKGRERIVYMNPVRFRVAWADARHLLLCYDDAQFLPGAQRPEPRAGQSPQDLVEVQLVKPATDCPAAAPRS